MSAVPVWASDSAIFTAVGANDTLVAEAPTARGADVNGRGDDSDFATALSYAASENNFKMAKFLLAPGARVNAEVRYGTAHTKAAENGHGDIVRLLLAQHANPNIGAYDTPLPIKVVIDNQHRFM